MSKLLSCAITVYAGLLSSGMASAGEREWVTTDSHGRLVYRTTPLGDRIMDFSYAGYGGGGVALPQAEVRDTLSPSGGDDTPAIQAKIDGVAARMSPGTHGAIVLKAGVYRLASTLILRTGIVLRGEGENSNQTVLTLTGAPHLGIRMGQSISEKALGPSVPIIDAYIPSGTSFVHLLNARAFKPGDIVRITAPVTPAWLRFMGMDHLSRKGTPETWLAGKLAATRTIAAVASNGVGFSVPLSHAYDARYFGRGGVQVTRIEQTQLSSEMGLERLRIVAPARQVELSQPLFSAISVDGARDVWVRDVSIVDTTNDVDVNRGASRVTFERIAIQHSSKIIGAPKPFAFSLTGTQVLIDRCSAQGDADWYVATNRDVQGPNVVLNSHFYGDGAIEPHQRWATGLLIDSTSVSGGGISLQNRGEMGSGHGWTSGWSVSWNNRATWLLIQRPPGALNWSIGDIGGQEAAPMPTFPKNPNAVDEPRGVIEHAGAHVLPTSLYLAQLQQRAGLAAIHAIGY